MQWSKLTRDPNADLICCEAIDDLAGKIVIRANGSSSPVDS
jgi:hypothetical protein